MDTMANILKGAHIGASNQQGENLPSIFDYLAQDSLRTSMKPGLLALLKFLGQFSPKISLFVQKHFDEFYLMFDTILENHYLSKFSASFAENFYGLKRVPLRMGNLLKIFRRRIQSLVMLVFIPYFAEKFEKLYEKHANDQREHLNSQPRSGWRQLILRLYPKLKALILLIFFLFQIGYTFSLTSCPSPLLFMAGIRLERLSPEDINRIQSYGSQTPIHMRNGSLFSTLWRFFLWLPSTLGRYLSYGLFLLQFLEYCYTDELGKRFGEIVGGHHLQISEFPIHTLPSEQQVICMEVDKCPLCKRVRQQDTVISVSGYVFCHSCIYNFVRLNGHCPITSLPASTNELVKIFH